ncbi:DnaA N-terminal domain-containing protein [Bacillus atrophaeus]|uniref:DnaA N-terminal domain-containing protein n=1 Tax=Bacillus atrophaeus TaxID=1452 RepID=UPI0022818587|nr:DnaA N-terminal domain-containing protein [Bacillus atrophaeus]MCY8467307.1 hypothetical protein [Bacillus atrophaeus]MCY8479927.1 hypothetical protein [Bacillus atrophaeus]
MFDDFDSSSSLLPDSHLYRFYRLVPSGEKETRIRNGKPVEVSLNQKEYYSEKDVAEFDLEEYSKLLPDMNGNVTIINNYFIRFWGPSFHKKMGGIIAYTFIILRSYCWDKDYTWISLSTLEEQLTVSRPTLKQYLDVLEKEGFIIRFWREAKDSKKTEQNTILIKVRRAIPYLTKEKLDKLSDSVKREHQKFLRKVQKESHLEFEQAYNYTTILENFRQKSIEVYKPEAKSSSSSEQSEKLYEQMLQEFDYDKLINWRMILQRIKGRFKESTFETWFKHTLGEEKDGTWIIYCRSKFERDRIDLKYRNVIQEAIEDLAFPFENLKITLYKSR